LINELKWNLLLLLCHASLHLLLI
jgi:hypothetical protein